MPWGREIDIATTCFGQKAVPRGGNLTFSRCPGVGNLTLALMKMSNSPGSTPPPPPPWDLTLIGAQESERNTPAARDWSYTCLIRRVYVFRTLSYSSPKLELCRLGPGARFSKVPKLFGRISSDIVLVVSSKQRHIEARNFAVI